jgi:DNA-binding transcriptional LysR family regulator
VNYPYQDEWRFVDRKGQPASVKTSGRLVSNSGEALVTAALQGVGICLAPGFMVHDDLEAGRLVRLLPEYRPIELSMNAVYPHRHHLSAKVRTFIDMLAHHSSEQQKRINPYS